MEVLTPTNAENLMTMQSMVDMALGTPEVGAVNFSVLHTLLHAMLKKMEIDQTSIDVPATDSTEPAKPSISINTTPYHQLQDRMKIMESQISDLNSLPRTNDIVSGFIDGGKPEEAKRTVSDLWQVLNLRKKAGANEEGIDRLSSLMDSLLGEIRSLKDDNKSMKQRLDELSGLKGLGDKVNGMENDLANLQDELNKLKNKLSEYPSPDSFKNVVTWEALEKALHGIKDDMDELKKPSEKIFINMATEPMSRPPSSHGSFGPSEACAEILEKLGTLTDLHFALEKRVVSLEEEMPNKADKKDLENLKIPDDLLKTIDLLKSQVEQLMAGKNRPITDSKLDNEALARIREIINGLQDKMKQLNETVDKVDLENKDLVKKIEELFGITSDHENRKADISYVDAQLRTKADKSLVDSKVGLALFDETTSNLHNLIDDVLKKLLAAEDELRNLLASLAADLQNKVDKDDLNALKEWIEKRLRSMAERLKNLRGGLDITDDEAAGLRKQLLQHFHCISCDRPVDMAPQGVNYGDRLPDPKGLPPTKSMRPYTTYELDTIRQHAKSMQMTRVINPKYLCYGADVVDVYQTPRPCGGSHTTTYSHKRLTRANNGNMNNSYVEEEPSTVQRLTKEELDIQGSDGHIYKGRFDRNQTSLGTYSNHNNTEATNQDRLPPVTVPQARSATQTPRGAFVTRPKSAVRISPRPANVPTGTTNNGAIMVGATPAGSRPMSARAVLSNPDSRPSSPYDQQQQQQQVPLETVEITTEIQETEKHIQPVPSDESWSETVNRIDLVQHSVPAPHDIGEDNEFEFEQQ